MKICIYKGFEKIVEKSGVGCAIRHQETMLRDAGCDVVSHMDAATEAVHLNTVFPDSLIEALIAKICKKTVIYYGHSTMEDFRYSFKGSNFFAPMFRTWIKFCYNMGDVILTPTEYSYAYQGSDLFCFMSHEETEGIVVLEALACEIPVLVRDIPVYEDWLEKGVNVYKAVHTDEFVYMAEKILNGSLPDLSKQGREVAKERAFPVIADKMKRIYQKYVVPEGRMMHENINC